jgi:excisionase family DNA binding protein
MSHNTIYRPKEAAEALHVSIATIWRWVKDGQLSAVKVGNRITLIKGVDELILNGMKGGV